MSKIAIVVPTIRPETIPAFKEAWKKLFIKHDISFILVVDGDEPKVIYKFSVNELIDEQILEKTKTELDTENLISNFCAGIRQLGFLYIAKYLPEVEYIITLDDDETPIGDPIQDHIDALNMKVPTSWLSTASDYMRGFPYGVRTESPVMLSHGVWEGVYDWDAPSQLLKGNKKVEFYKGVIPKGIFFPMCGMNLAFRREVLPYIYFAPVGQYKGAERFDDIFAGLEIVKDFADFNYGIVSGYAKCNHLRASNVFTSLEKEAVGIRKLEEYWQGIYDEWYEDFLIKRSKWIKLTQ